MPFEYKRSNYNGVLNQNVCKEIVTKYFNRTGLRPTDKWQIRTVDPDADDSILAVLYKNVVFKSAEDLDGLYWADSTGKDHSTPYKNISMISTYDSSKGGKRKSKKQTKSKKSNKSNKSNKNKNQRK